MVEPLVFKILLSTLEYFTCDSARYGYLKIRVEDDELLDTAISTLATITLPKRFLKSRPERLRVVLLHKLLHVK